ncbi:MAG: dipeptide ABC transporter ATP-binding protein [Geminicoccaceae bacterium]
MSGSAANGMDEPPVLEARDISISYFTRAGETKAVHNVSFVLPRGRSLGLVGESGCGKSTIAYAVMRYLGRAGKLVNGQILFEGEDLYQMSEAQIRDLRGGKVAMVYQEPMSSLNPTMKIGRQLMEVPILHLGAAEAEARQRAIDMLQTVKMPDPKGTMNRYPHQISGGQQQRVVIAMALMTNPHLLVLDEPTTALDVSVQAGILDLIEELRAEFNASILYISHDLGTVARICDDVGVMYFGEMVEYGEARQVFVNPRHEYSQKLLSSIPKLTDPLPERGDDSNLPLALEVSGLEKTYTDKGMFSLMGSKTREVKALKGVDLYIKTGKTLGLVGESGCGKSTLAKVMLGLEEAETGQILLSGNFDLARAPVEKRTPDVLSQIQMIFQNPDGTLNPSHSIGYTLARPLKRLGKAKGDVREQVAKLLEAVRLPREFARRKPHQLSGGQKQRIGIARALASSPEIIIADEPTSALDVSVQATVIDLLNDLQRERELTMLFISHDLALVRSIADYVAVIYKGEVVDFGPTEEVFTPPHHPYTQELLDAVPLIPTADVGTNSDAPAP